MKKKQLLASLFLASLAAPGAVMAQDVVKFTTAKTQGETVSVTLNQLKHGAVVDWGDGNTQTFEPTADAYLVIEGQVKGETITITSQSPIKTIICADNALTDIDVSGLTSLYSLYCQNNQLTQLDLSACNKLTDLNCAGNELTKISVTEFGNPDLETLNVAGNQLKSNSLTGTSFALPCQQLQYLNIADNAVTTVSLTAANGLLDVLKCSGNKIKILNLTNISSLSTLMCADNAITGLTINAANGLPELRQLIASGNKIAKMDLSLSSDLNYLAVENNALTQLAIPAKTKLYAYSCGGNSLTFSSLPTADYMPELFSYLPQTEEINISSKFKKAADGMYYAPLCPSYNDRNDEAYFVDLTDWSFDADNQRNTITFNFFGKNNGETEYAQLSKASSSNKNGDYYTPTAVSLYGNYSFLKPHDEVYIEITSSNYPDLKYTTTHFRVGEKATAIETATTAGDALNVTVQNRQLVIAGKGQPVRVYRADGSLQWQGQACEGGTQLNLPAGVYVVNGKKVAL